MRKKENIFDESLVYFENMPNRFGFRNPKSSFHLTQWTVRHSSLIGDSKLVAAAIATCYSSKIHYAFPSYEHLAELTGLSKSTIARSIRKIRLSGEWIVIPQKRTYSTSHGGQSSNRYIPLSPRNQKDKRDKNNHWQSWAVKKIYDTIEGIPRTEDNYLKAYSAVLKSSLQIRTTFELKELPWGQ